MAFLEDALDGAADSDVQLDAEDEAVQNIGEEVEGFAKFLDECIILRGSAPEQRARIFKLVDHYYGYARETADVLRERLRLARLARGSSGESSSSSTGGGGGGGGGGGIRSTGLVARRTGLRSGGGGDRHHADQADAQAAAQRWEEEAQTWDLLRRLLPLRYRDKAAGAVSGSGAAADKPPQSRREYWADFVLSEPKARERKTILEWLQASASSSGPDLDEVVQDLQRSADRGEILAHGWLHTRVAIKQHKRLVARSDPLAPDSPDLADSNLDQPQKLVTQLDPDVVARQAAAGRKLAPQDAFFEQALWVGCYELLRRGKSMADLRDWCTERTEVWRAAAISALPLANSDGSSGGSSGGGGGGGIGGGIGGGDDDDAPDFDCLATVLWRRMCYRLSQEATAGLHQRAVYGILAGDLASVEAVGASWDDLTFAKYNAELRAQFDAYLLRQADPAAAHALLLLHGDVPVLGSNSNSSSSGGGGGGGGENRHHRGADRASAAYRAAASTPAKALQAAIIDEKLDGYLFQQGALLADYANRRQASKLIPQYDTTSSTSTLAKMYGTAAAESTKFVEPTDCHGLRVLAHVLIVVSALDKLDGKGKDVAALGPLARRHQTEEHAIAAYISFLRLARLEELIPLYASKLLGDRCYASLTLNLIHVDERDVQLRLLQLMRKQGLDAFKFVQTVPQLFLADVAEQPGVCPARATFSMLESGAPSLKFGRMIRPGIFGPVSELPDESDDVVLVDKSDELLIRSLEWMLLVDGLIPEMCDYGVRIYKYLLKNEHLTSARVLTSRVSCMEIVRRKTRFGDDLPEDNDPVWWEDLFGTQTPSPVEADVDAMMDEDPFGGSELSKNQVSVYVRPLFELECLVNALDCLETTAVLCSLMASAENVDSARDRTIAKNLDDNAKLLRGYMKPLLKDWLLHGVDDDPDASALRETYLPQIIIGYASTLQCAGTTASRDYLLECMDLAATVAAPDSDVAPVLVAGGRMKELIESFASCSKALAIWTSDLKKGPGANSKKTRELGWTRELWSVKP